MIAHRLRPFDPLQWLRKTAPIELKLTIAFTLSSMLTCISLLLGWWAFGRVWEVTGSHRAELEPVRDALAASRFLLMAAAIGLSYLFGRIIAVPYITVVRRMETLAQGDLDAPIPFVMQGDCVGRIAKAMQVFRNTALAEHETAERSRLQAADLRVANAKLKQLAQDLSQSADAADRASRAKSRFLASMSHELRTPLNGLLGYARLLRLDGPMTPVQDQRIDAMLGAGAHLLDMINRVLVLAEVESGRIELRPVAVDVRDTAAACLDMVRPTAVMRGLALSLLVHPDTPQKLTTDATRVRQVLLNLLGNAIKFTEHGTVEMRLSPSRQVENGVRVEVADTGPGISSAERVHLFQEFERLDPAIAEKAEGAGLGLALSMRLTQVLGGAIGHADNTPGGSIFWLELPAMEVPQQVSPPPASAPAATAPAEAKPVEAKRQRHLNVLVVDDIAMNREIATAFLESAGHQVTCADGGQEAVAKVAAADFDVVVMDVRMPEMDGLEATRRIRALPSPRSQVPIVAMTAQAFAEQVSECRRAGMNGHVSKPFAPEALTEAVALAARPPGSTSGSGSFIGMDRNEAAPAMTGDKTIGGNVMSDKTTGEKLGRHPGYRRAEIAGNQNPSVDNQLGTNQSGTNQSPEPRPNTLSPLARAALAPPPDFDPVVFARTANLLAPTILATSLRTIAARAEGFLRRAAGSNGLASDATELAELAHTLGGSAGMFGFGRLAFVAKRFEFAVHTRAADTLLQGGDLVIAVRHAHAELTARLAAIDSTGSWKFQPEPAEPAGTGDRPMQSRVGEVSLS